MFDELIDMIADGKEYNVKELCDKIADIMTQLHWTLHDHGFAEVIEREGEFYIKLNPAFVEFWKKVKEIERSER